MRSVCGCMPTRSAATLIMYIGRSFTTAVSGSAARDTPSRRRRARRWRSTPRAARRCSRRSRQRARGRPCRSRRGHRPSRERRRRPRPRLPRSSCPAGDCAPLPSPARAPDAGPRRAARHAESLAAQPVQLLQQIALLLVDALRHLDAHAREHVALTGAGQARCAAALDAQQLAVFGAGGNLERDGALRRRHVDLAAEGGHREGHRHLDDEIVAAPFVRLGRRHVRHDDEVARGTAVLPGLALALEADLRAVLDAGLDLHGVRLDAALASGAVALRTRLLDDGPVAAAARTRLRQREEPLALRLHAATVALGTDHRRRAGLRTGAAAFAACGRQLDRNPDLGAPERVLEGELHLDRDVVAANRLTACARPPAGPAAEDAAEQVAEIADVEPAEVEVDVLPARPGTAAVRRAEAVVLLALRVVREHVVGGLHLLEALLRRGVAGVSVRVVLARELAIRLLDLVLRGALRNTEGLVEGLSHRSRSVRRSRPAPAARRGRR